MKHDEAIKMLSAAIEILGDERKSALDEIDNKRRVIKVQREIIIEKDLKIKELEEKIAMYKTKDIIQANKIILGGLYG